MSMTSREQFEQAIKARFGDSIDYRVCKNSDGEYMAWDMQVAWWAWQAASKASEQQLAAVVAENASVKAMNDCLSEELRGYESDGAFDGPKMHLLWWKSKTPATDAAIANIQAQGVEMFADRKQSEMMSLHPDTHAVGSIAAAMSAEVKELHEFAAQLRQGGEQ